VDRAFFGDLRFFGAEVFFFREFHADGVFHFALGAFEERALLALHRADVGGLRLPRESAGDVVFERGRARRGRGDGGHHQARCDGDERQRRHQSLLHPRTPPVSTLHVQTFSIDPVTPAGGRRSGVGAGYLPDDRLRGLADDLDRAAVLAGWFEADLEGRAAEPLDADGGPCVDGDPGATEVV